MYLPKKVNMKHVIDKVIPLSQSSQNITIKIVSHYTCNIFYYNACTVYNTHHHTRINKQNHHKLQLLYKKNSEQFMCLLSAGMRIRRPR